MPQGVSLPAHASGVYTADCCSQCCDLRHPSESQGVDLLVHAAGPFQRRTECNVLEACIAAGVPYMDVCDDADYSQRAKKLHQK